MAKLRLESTLSLDGRQFFGVLHTAEGAAQRFAGQFKSLIGGAFSAAALINLGRHILETADRWADVAEQIGSNTTDVQALEAAFIRAGLGADAAVTAALKLSKAIDSAEPGGVIERAGVSMQELAMHGEDTVSVMRELAEEMSTLDRRTQRDIAREIFGEKAGEKFLAALAELRKTKGETFVSPEDVRNIDEAARRLEELKRIATAKTITGLSDATRGRGWMMDLLFPVGTMMDQLDKVKVQLGRFNASMNPFRAAAGQAGGVTGGAAVEQPAGPMMSFPRKDEFDRWQAALKLQRDLEEDILRIQLRMMSATKQRATIEMEVNKLLREAKAAQDRGDISAAGALQKEALALAGQFPTERRETPQLNQLQRVGGFAGPGEDRITSTMRRQVTLLERIDQSVRENTRAVKEQGGDNFGN